MYFLRKIVLGRSGWQLLFLTLALSLLSVVTAAANYIGPANRQYMQDGGTYTLRVCYQPSGQQYCSCIVDGGECGVTTNSCPDNGWNSCEEYEKDKPDVLVQLSPAAASASFGCTTYGSNGWCINGAKVTFTANEPVPGQAIQYIEGNYGIYCDPADASSVNCTWTPPQGQNPVVQYWAHSTHGDTSLMGQLPVEARFDSGKPTAGVGVGTPNGANGWFVSPVTATATGTDSVSGIAVLNVNLDGGTWQANGTNYATQGSHTVQGLATDKAGNQATSGTVTFKLDSVPPTVSATIPPANGSGGWFKTGPVNVGVSGTDATSGVASAQIQIGSGAWQSSTATISSDGVYTVNFRTTDAAGNTNTASGTVKLDQTNPIGSISLTGTLGANGWYVTRPVAAASGSDATSGVASSQVNLDGGPWAGTVSVPDGTHTVAGRVTDQAGNTGSIAASTIKVDTVLPTLVPSYAAANGSNGWYKTAVSLSVSGADATSGLAAAEIQVDGGAWQADNATIAADGSHSIVFRTRDHAGNVNTQSVTIKIDRSNPVVSITPTGTSGLAGWFLSPVSAGLSVTDATSGIATKEYRLDGGAWTSAASGLTLTDGVHTVELRATDNAGNTATTSRTISVDTTPPLLSKVVPAPDGSKNWYVSAVDLSVSGSDSGSGLAAAEIQVDGGSWSSGSARVSTDGDHTIGFRTRDVAGNSTTQTVIIAVDLAGPAITIVPTGKIGAGEWYISNVSVAASAVDAVSGQERTEYKVDSGGWTPLVPCFTLTDGVHSVSVRSYDAAGNVSVATSSLSVDTTAPVVFKTIPAPDGKNGWYRTNQSLAVGGTDATSGVDYAEIQVDDGTWTRDKIVASGDGSHALNFRVVDHAGNVRTAAASIKIDTTAPVAVYSVPFGRLGEHDWYSSPSVTGAVSVTDATSGLAAVSYQIDGAAWATGSSAVVTKDGVHTLRFSYSDHAGNTAALTRTIKIDATLPEITPISTGTEGKNQWWTSPVVVDPNPSDQTAGVAKTEISINGAAWQAVNKVTLDQDGLYTVKVRVTDQAGNVLTGTLNYQVDTTAPVCLIKQPAEGQMLKGKVPISGSCSDGGAGLETIVISVDGGKTWTEIPSAGGEWAYTWDTVLYPGPVMIQGTDRAGNEEVGDPHAYPLVNAPPRVALQEQWYIWNSGSLKVWAGDLPVTKVEIRIADGNDRWPAREWTFETIKDVPGEIKWDRKFADGTLAPIGDYTVRVTVWDSNQRSATDQGKVVIPAVPQPTAQVKATLAVTPTAMPSPTPTLARSPMPTATSIATSTAMAIAPVAQPDPPVGVHVPPVFKNDTGLLLAFLTLLGLLLALGFQAVRDPRPQAIHQLADTFVRLSEHNKQK